MAVQLLPGVIPEFLISGVPASGALLFTYAAGTTTKQATYTDATGSVAQTNPIVLNARGEPQNSGGASVGLWLTQGLAYKFVLAPSTDTDPPTNPIWTVDNVLQSNLTGSSYTATGTNAISLTPITGTPTITAYANFQQFSFVAANTSTGAVTMQVGALGFLPLYYNGAQAGSGTIQAGQLVVCQYVSSLGAGGAFVMLPTLLTPNILQGTDTGSANAYVINPSPGVSAYAADQVAVFIAANANTTSATLNVNGLGAKAIKTTALANLASGQIAAGAAVIVVYDGTQFQLLNPAAASAYNVDTGSANAYAITPTPAIAAYVAGQTFNVKIANSNTTTSTLNVSGVGAANITRTDGSNVIQGDLIAGGVYTFVYTGSAFQVLNTTPTVPKIRAIAQGTISGGTLTVNKNIGFSSITRSGAGAFNFNFNTGVVLDGNFVVSAVVENTTVLIGTLTNRTGSTFSLSVQTTTNTPTDPTGFSVTVIE